MRRMLIFGHRGLPNRRVAENTLISFVQAMQAGVDGIECDVRLSRDGLPVILHDENLARVAGDARRCKNLTAKELSKIELRGAGHIPELNELTMAIPQPYLINLEIKDPDAAACIIAKLKTSSGLRARTLVSSFHFSILQDFKTELPEIKRIALMHTWTVPGRKQAVWPNIFKLEPWGFGTRVSSLTPSRIRWLHARDLKAVAYEDRPSALATKRMVKLEVDVAITFKPDLCRQLWNKNNQNFN